jgi:hypothetical protein
VSHYGCKSLLSIAYVALLVLPVCQKYYQFSNPRSLHKAYSSNRIAEVHTLTDSPSDWTRGSYHGLLLDRRFSPEHIYWFSFLFFSLVLTVDCPKQVSLCDRGRYAPAIAKPCCLRGPPDDPAIS